MTNARLKAWIKRKATFLKAINLLGGKCFQCCEDRVWCLDFHHLDKTNKEYDLANLLTSGNWDLINIELEKCIVLCSNCHRDEHFNKDRYLANQEEIIKRSLGWVPKRENRKRQWTFQEETDLISMYNQGLYIDNIARQLARSEGAIARKIETLLFQNRIEKSERTRRATRKKMSDEDIWSLWDAGNTAIQVSSILSISRSRVYKTIKKKENNEN